MINAVGREIPEEVLKATGKEPFKGVYAYDNYEYTKAAPTVRTLNDPTRSKLVENIHDALVKCGIKDGMVLSFHHHFREGDYVVNMVMEEVHKMGIKDITICASSLGKAHDPIVPYIEDGTITGIQSSGVRGKIGEAISTGRELLHKKTCKADAYRVFHIRSVVSFGNITFSAIHSFPAGNDRAAKALAAYNYRVVKYIGAYTAAMDGVDVIAFTAGLGENGKSMRKAVCEHLSYLGIKIDDEANSVRGKDIVISTPDSKVKVMVIPTNEELAIARETLALVK